MATYKLKSKLFTQWDDTDAIKRMKDSDILAEKKKRTSIAPIARGTGFGAAAGSAIGGLSGAILGLKKGGLKSAGKGLVAGSTAGAMAGGALGGAAGTFKTAKEANANRFYNRRLDYAQRQAMRREKKDWKSNMTEREGYSY